MLITTRLINMAAPAEVWYPRGTRYADPEAWPHRLPDGVGTKLVFTGGPQMPILSHLF